MVSLTENLFLTTWTLLYCSCWTSFKFLTGAPLPTMDVNMVARVAQNSSQACRR
jgi:hypothetical protein